MKSRRIAVSLTLGIAVVLGLTFIVPSAVYRTGAGGPPEAMIVYSAATGKGLEYRLYLAEWPDPKPRLLTPEVIGKYGLGDYVSAPQFSPDGSKVLFMANRALPNGKQVESDGIKGVDLWILDLKANTARPLTTDGASYEHSQWSPDGKYVSAVSHEGYWPEPPLDSIEQWKLNLYVWDVSTGKRTLLASHVNGLAWSRDSEDIYYEGSPDRWGPSVLRVPRQGGKSELVQSQVQWIGWVSPNGKYLSFGGLKLGVRDLDTGATRYLVSQKTPIMQPTHRWSPDSRSIALMDVIHGGYPIRAGLMILDSRSGRRKSIERVTSVSAIVGWSGRGDRIILTRYNNLDDPEDESLCAVSATTGEVTPIFALADATGLDWHELPAR